MDAKTEFNAGMLEGAFATKKSLNWDEIRMYSGMSQVLRDFGRADPTFRCPIHIRAEAAVMDDEFKKMNAVWEEVKDYIDESEISLANSLIRPKMFVPTTEADYREAERIINNAIKDAREKKARHEAAAKEEAEYQQRKAATRASRPSAPEPEVKPLPQAGKVMKKDDDEFAAFSGAGAGKKGKRK
jgi:hypothetical protein